MDGLEATEVSFGNLQYVIDYRIEAEYFNKRFIENEELLNSCCCKSFNEEAKVINGRPYSSERFTSIGDVYVSKIGDVTNKKDSQTWEMVDQQEFDCNKGDYLNDFDILMTLTGDPPDVGKTNMVLTNGTNCTWNQRVANICRKSNYYISNFVLYAVLSTDICRMQMERYAKGIRQRNLGNDCFNFIKIPKLGSDLQKIIDLTVKAHINSLKSSSDCYNNAKKELEQIVALKNYKTNENTSRKNLSDSFLKTGRLDAEYYQPKYEHIEKELATNETVLSLCNLYDSSFNPETEKQYKYIELANVGKCGEVANVEILEGKELPSRARRIVKTGQVIISSVEGSLDSCALITEEYNDALCSTGFFVIDSDKINSETLLILFKSEAIQALLKQRCSGTILTAISKEELLNMPLPEIDDDVQKVIASKVQESFALRKKSKDLLECAKKAVEMAIEQGEETAIEWLKDKTQIE